MDIGTGCENTGKIDFGFAAASATSRQWEVKVTQIECSSRSRYVLTYTLGVKVQNMKMDFNTWRHLALGRTMNTNDENL